MDGNVITQRRKELFLRAFAQSGNVTAACSESGIGRHTHYDWLKADPEYGKAFEDAREAVADKFEAEAVRRGIDGWDEPVFYRGVECGRVRRYSDQLLMLLMRGSRPGKYQHRVEHSGEVQTPTPHQLPQVVLILPDNGRGDASR